jgi:hypothetical protein
MYLFIYRAEMVEALANLINRGAFTVLVIRLVVALVVCEKLGPV